MICANVYNFIKQRSVALLTLTLGFIISPAICLAQDPDNPCNGTDPFSDCPIDSWVIFLAGIALVATTLYLHRKQKAALQTA